MKKYLLFITFVLLAAALFSCAMKKVDGKNDPAASGETTKSIETDEITTVDEMAQLKEKLPACLPDGKAYEIAVREGFENPNDYVLRGSHTTTNYSFKDVKGVFGGAIAVTAYPGGKSAMFQFEPNAYYYKVGECAGILFWVDLTNTQPDPNGKGSYVSVVLDTDASSIKDFAPVVGYYQKDGKWIETHNESKCYMQVPDQFTGWVYIPAGAYDAACGLQTIGSDGSFAGRDVFSLGLISGGYDLTKTDFSVIFDEILFVKAK